MKFVTLTGISSGFALAVAFMPSPARAQGADTQGAGNQDIIVTAQRRSERLQDVPITMTAIGAQQLEQASIQGLSGIAKLTPALRFDNQGGFAQPTIRGVGSAVTTSGSGSNVGIYIDGFYSPNPLQADFQLLNVEGVQVLKGPQGTLFGRNATGGAILVTTSKPSFDPSAMVEASYGSFNTQRYQAYATGGLGSKVAVDIAGIYRKSDGYLRNIVTGSRKDQASENWSVRAGVRADVSDSVSFLLRYTHSDVDDPSSVATNAYVLNGATQSAGALFGATVAIAPREISYTSPNVFRAKADIVQLTGEFDTGFATLTSYTQYRHETAFTAEDFDASSFPIFDLTFGNRDKVFTQEFILNSKPGPDLQWTVGLFYFRNKNHFDDVSASVAGAPYALFGGSGTDTRSAAAFIDMTYSVTDTLFVTGGLRYSHDLVRNAFFFEGPLRVAFGLAPAVGTTQVPSIKDDRVTPRIVLRYAPDSRSSVFASYSKGYKAGILNVGGFTGTPIKPETIDAFEVGYKYASRALSFDVSAYYYDYKDLQLASFDSQTSIVKNASNSRVYGLEAQLRYHVTAGLTLSAGGAYVNAKYKDFQDSPLSVQCTDFIACGLLYGLYPSGNTVDASGFEMLRAPKFTGNAGLNYTALLAGGKLGLSGNLFYTSKFFFDSSNQFVQKGYELLSLRAEWTDPSDRYTFAIYGENVTGAKYRTQVLPGQYAILQTWGAPATVGASVRAKF